MVPEAWWSRVDGPDQARLACAAAGKLKAASDERSSGMDVSLRYTVSAAC
jgi:hypothetical protein